MQKFSSSSSSSAVLCFLANTTVVSCTRYDRFSAILHTHCVCSVCCVRTGEREGSDVMDLDECEDLQQLTWWSKKQYVLASAIVSRQFHALSELFR